MNGMIEKLYTAPDGGAETKTQNIIIIIMNGMNEKQYGALDGGAETKIKNIIIIIAINGINGILFGGMSFM